LPEKAKPVMKTINKIIKIFFQSVLFLLFFIFSVICLEYTQKFIRIDVSVVNYPLALGFIITVLFFIYLSKIMKNKGE